MSKPKEYSSVTKDKLMTYTFVALLILAVVSAVLWSGVTDISPKSTMFPNGFSMNLGLEVALISLIAVGVAVGIDVLFNKLISDSPLNIMSAAVFGIDRCALILIRCSSYGRGTNQRRRAYRYADRPSTFVFVALISMVGNGGFQESSRHGWAKIR